MEFNLVLICVPHYLEVTCSLKFYNINIVQILLDKKYIKQMILSLTLTDTKIKSYTIKCKVKIKT